MQVFIEKSTTYHPPSVPISAYSEECDSAQTNWPLVLSTQGLRETGDNNDALKAELGRVHGKLNVQYGADWQNAATDAVFGTSVYLRDESKECAALVCKGADAFIDAGGRIENNRRTGLLYASMTPETRLTVYPGLKLHHMHFPDVAVPYGLSEVGGNAVVTALKLASLDLSTQQISDAYVFTADKFQLPVPRAIRDITFCSDAASALHVTTAPKQPLFKLELAHVERARPFAIAPRDERTARFADLVQAINGFISQLVQTTPHLARDGLQIRPTGLSPRVNRRVCDALRNLGWRVGQLAYDFDTCNANISSVLHQMSTSVSAEDPTAQLIVNLCASGTIGYVLLENCEI